MDDDRQGGPPPLPRRSEECRFHMPESTRWQTRRCLRRILSSTTVLSKRVCQRVRTCTYVNKKWGQAYSRPHSSPCFPRGRRDLLPTFAELDISQTLWSKRSMKDGTNPFRSSSPEICYLPSRSWTSRKHFDRDGRWRMEQIHSARSRGGGGFFRRSPTSR